MRSDDIEVRVFRNTVRLPLLAVLPVLVVLTLYVIVYLGANARVTNVWLDGLLHDVLKGRYTLGEIVIDPTLHDAHVYSARMTTPAGESVVEVDEIHANVRLLKLLDRNITIERGVVRGARVTFWIEDTVEGELNLFRALGFDQPDPDKDPNAPLPVEFHANDVRFEDSFYSIKLPIFRLAIPDILIPRGEVHVSNAQGLQMAIPSLELDRAHLWFNRKLFNLDEEYGDLSFTLRRFKARDWRWDRDGYEVESMRADADGVVLKVSGEQRFPGDPEGMYYDAQVQASAAYWSPLPQYFIRENMHFEAPSITAHVRGTLETIRATGQLLVSELEANRVTAHDIEAAFELNDEILTMHEGRVGFHGGVISLRAFLLDVLALHYGVSATFEGVNLASVLRDLESEQPMFEGRTSGAFVGTGTVPRGFDFVKGEPTSILRHATDRWIDLTFDEDVVTERSNREMFPWGVVRIPAGGRMWVTLDHFVVPYGEVRMGPDRMVVQDMAIDYGQMLFAPVYRADGFFGRAELADIDAYLSHHGAPGYLSGPMTIEGSAIGMLMAPDMKMKLRVDQPLLFGGKVRGESIESRFDVDSGTLRFDELRLVLDAEAGEEISMTGSVGAMRAPPRPKYMPVLELYAGRDDMPLALTGQVRQVRLDRLKPFLPPKLELSGLLNVGATIQGSTKAPRACVVGQAVRMRVQGQPIPEVFAKAGVRDARGRGGCAPLASGVRPSGVGQLEVEQLRVLLDPADVGRAPRPGEEDQRAGVFGRGVLRFNKSFDGEVWGQGLDLSRLEALRLFDVELRGQGRFRVIASGDVRQPHVWGDVRVRGVEVRQLVSAEARRAWQGFEAASAVVGRAMTRAFGDRLKRAAERAGAPTREPRPTPWVRLGDLALVLNTTRDEANQRQIFHVLGALLPWVTITVEGARDPQEPLRVTIAADKLDVMRLVQQTNLIKYAPELEALRVLERAQVTGRVELELPQDRPGFRALVTVSDVRFGPRRHNLTNDKPIVFNYVQQDIGDGEVFKTLRIEQLSLGADGHFVQVKGEVSPDDQFMDLRVDGELDLRLLRALRIMFPGTIPDQLMDATGRLEIHSSFKGTPDRLRADGEMSWSRSELKLRSLPDPMVIRGGTILLDADKFRIPREKPMTGEAMGGVFAVWGEMKLVNYLPREVVGHLWSHNMTYSMPDYANFTFDTSLHLVAGDFFDYDTWKVTGRVDFLDGLFYQNISVYEEQFTGRVLGTFGRQTKVYQTSVLEEMPELKGVEFDVAIRARDGFKIKNQVERFELDLELRIDLRLTSDLADPKVHGSVDVLDGTIVFQGEKFQVRSGLVRFSGDMNNPYLDIVAGADIRNTCQGVALAEDFTPVIGVSGATADTVQNMYHISLNVRGMMDKLNLIYEATPFADQRDVISLILTGCTVDQLTASSASQPTLEIALGPLIGRLEREIQDVVKFEEVTIMPGVERTQVRISDSLSRRLSWNFQLDTGINNSTGVQYKLEYKLTDRWSTQMSTATRTENNQLMLDLKLKYRLPIQWFRSAGSGGADQR